MKLKNDSTQNWVYPYQLKEGDVAVIRQSHNLDDIGMIVVEHNSILVGVGVQEYWIDLIPDEGTTMMVEVLEPGTELVI